MTSHPSGSSMTTLYTACAGAALTLTLALAYEAGRRSTSSLPGGSAGGGGAAGRKVGRIGAPFSSLPGEGFFDKLNARAKAINSLLCVGLDPHMKQLDDKTAKGALNFCKALVDATKDVALAYKPNAAFFEVFGEEGAAALKDLVQYVPADIPVLLDGKRGDIGTTAEAYAAAAFEDLGVEAVTVNAYMGRDTVEPFIKDASRGTFVLCKTSNPSSKEVQSLQVSGEGVAVFERLASLASDWNVRHNIGLVVGATDADALRRARAAAPQLWILAPGIGAQGGNLDEACAGGLRGDGLGLLVPISRGISSAPDPGAAARQFALDINLARAALTARDTTQSRGILPYQEEFLSFAASQKVLKFGSFTLKSGRQSPYFFNAGLFNSGHALAKLGQYYAEAIMRADPPIEFDVLFGPAYKGISLAAVVAYALDQKYARDVGFAYNRKEKKSHGEGGTLVGADLKGKRVLIIDDVITAGTAIREAMGMMEEAGAIPAGVVIALDREEKAPDSDKSAVQQVEEQYSIPVLSVIGLRQIAAFLEEGDDAEMLRAVKEYRAKYGV